MAEGKLTDSMTGEVLADEVGRRVGGGAVDAAAQWEWGDAENARNTWAQDVAQRLYSWTWGAAQFS